MLKKVLSLALCIGIVAGICGCGKKGGHKLTGESINVVVQTNGLGVDWIEKTAERYTYETGVEVNVQFDALLSQNMDTVLMSDTMECADVYFGQSADWVKYYKNDLIADLTDIMTDSSDGESLVDRCLVQDYYVEGDDGSKHYAMIPLTMGPIGMAYNKGLLNYLCHDVLKWEAGHDYPKTTKEMNEVIGALNDTIKNGSKKDMFTYSAAGKKMDVKPFAWSGSIGTLEFLFKAWMQQYWGSENIDKYYAQQSAPDMFNDEAFYVCYQEIMNLLDLKESGGAVTSVNSIPNCLSYNHTESQAQFLLGHALFIPAGSWLYSESSSLMTDLDNWGFMPVPVLTDNSGKAIAKDGVTVPTDKDGNYIAVLGINNQDYMFIPKRSQKQDLAKDFLKFMFGRKSLAKMEEDIQAPVCFKCDDENIKLNGWAKQVNTAVQNSVENNAFCKTYTTNPLYGVGALNFISDSLPYAKLAKGGYGSVNKYYDSKTLQPISSPAAAKGIAISENVYKYVQWNVNYKLSHWNEYKRIAGVL